MSAARQGAPQGTTHSDLQSDADEASSVVRSQQQTSEVVGLDRLEVSSGAIVVAKAAVPAVVDPTVGWSFLKFDTLEIAPQPGAP